MFDVLIKALGFVIVIVIGFLLKQFRILKKEDGYTLATIIMNVHFFLMLMELRSMVL